MTLEIVTGRVSGGSASAVAPTYTATASTSNTNYPTGASLFMKIMANIAAVNDPNDVYMRHGKSFSSDIIQPFSF
jgi:hypothetical protein